jgi:hypothetical protein
VQGSTNGLRRKGPLRQGVVGHPPNVEGYTIIGFDPAMGDKAHAGFVAITYNRIDSKIYVLDCINMAEPNPQKIRSTIEELVLKYKPQELRVEINAHQKAYSLDEDLRQWLGMHGTRLESHVTNKNKWDAAFGVASMSTLFGTVREEKFQKESNTPTPP